MKPRYFDKGITAYWLDETDGEGTAGGDGVHGYDTTYGPAAAASNLWVNDWLSLFTEPVRGRITSPSKYNHNGFSRDVLTKYIYIYWDFG